MKQCKRQSKLARTHGNCTIARSCEGLRKDHGGARGDHDVDHDDGDAAAAAAAAAICKLLFHFQAQEYFPDLQND